MSGWRARLVPGIGNAVHVAAGSLRDGAASSLIVRADGAVLVASNEPSIFTAITTGPDGMPVAPAAQCLGRFLELRPAIP